MAIDEMFVSARRRRHADRRSRRTRRARRVLAVAGIVLIGAGMDLSLNIAYFYWRWHTEGPALVRREQAAIATAHRALATGGAPPAGPVCPPFSDASTAPEGLLEAPAIGLEAPVLSGVGDAQLGVAVGHVTTSAWPDGPGTVVLAAHDVSYFSQIDTLATGADVEFVTPCTTYLYRVTGHQIVARGAPLYTSPGQSLLVMETCYPLDALFFTPQRYLVTARLAGTVQAGQPVAAPGGPPDAPGVPAPAPLAAQGLSLAANETPLGRLGLAGMPAPAFVQSPAPLADEAAVLAEYFGAVRSAEQAQPGWWSALAPGVPPAAASPFIHAAVRSFPAALNPTLVVAGAALTGATVDVTATLSGGPAPGPWRIHVVMTVAGGKLEITQWLMTRP
ncbi:MAG TPA: sortase [Acidimicrobiales bacterium]|nr:sortase [Acidimicrobiales bacterium]